MVAVKPHILLSFLLQFTILASVQGLDTNNKIKTLNPYGITWDPSCRDRNPENKAETKQFAVERAWSGALELSESAWDRFQHTSKKLRQGPLSEEVQRTMNKDDPAYVQLFALDWSKEGVDRIEGVLKKLATSVNADPGTEGRPSELTSNIHISCHDSYMDEEDDGIIREQCEEDDFGFLGEQFEKHDGIVSGGSTLNLCPEFWKTRRYDRLKTAAQVSKDNMYDRGVSVAEYTLVHQSMWLEDHSGDTDACVLLHELSHISWIGPTNTPKKKYKVFTDIEETYGLNKCAKKAWNKGSPSADNLNVTWNADSYAIYAEYGRFVELMGRDPWKEYDKHVKIPVKYPDEDTC